MSDNNCQAGRTLVLVFLFVVGTDVPSTAIAAARSPVAMTQGTLVRVSLAEFAALGDDKGMAVPVGATGGLLFEFDILPTDGAPQASFTLSELRDVLVNGQSYMALTKAALGQTFEPHTEINKLAPHAETKLAKERRAQAVTMRVIIWGVAPPRTGSCDIALVLGWGPQTEKIKLVVPLSKLKKQ